MSPSSLACATGGSAQDSQPAERPIALVTGVGRAAGLGAAIVRRIAADGWDVAFSYWSAYDERMPWGRQDDDPARVAAELRGAGARCASIEADLADAETPARLFDAVESQLGAVTALVLSHCESVDSDLLATTVESFDRHMAVNARASWLLIRELARRYSGVPGAGRVVALTSDATVGNLPYGASKGALDRVVLAAARELAALRITANVVNPGPVDTGWMTAEQVAAVVAANPRGRAGRPTDVASLVSFLCSADGEWVNGQLLHSDGGLHA